MPDGTVALSEAAASYLASLADEERIANQAEVERFVRWCGGDRACELLRGQEVANYAETLAGGVTDATRRAEAVRAFLAYAKKAGYTSTNLGTHLRLRKAGPARRVRTQAVTSVQITEQEKAALAIELEALKAQRPNIVSDIQRARADKDFRENAPLDAARQQQGFIEGRIRQLESRLEHAVIIEPNASRSNETVEIGSTVTVRNLQTGAELAYTLVPARDVKAAQGRISYESPVGRALLQRRPGDEVEVTVPSGTLRFRIERVEG